MKKIDIPIFLDLDGVFANFDQGIFDRFGLDVKGESPTVGLPNHKSSPLPWDDLDYEFYSNLPVLPYAKELYSLIKSKFSNIFFLTGTIASEGCYSGKYAWLESFLGKSPQTKLILCPSEAKIMLAGPNRILVDDRIKTIVGWRDKGGKGILHYTYSPKSTIDIFKNWV